MSDETNVVPIEVNLPHYAGWARCRNCGFVAMDVCPVSTGGVDLECDKCGQMTVDLLVMTVDESCANELATLRQFRDDVMTVERHKSIMANGYCEQQDGEIEDYYRGLAAAIRARNAGKGGE